MHLNAVGVSADTDAAVGDTGVIRLAWYAVAELCRELTHLTAGCDKERSGGSEGNRGKENRIGDDEGRNDKERSGKERNGDDGGKERSSGDEGRISKGIRSGGDEGGTGSSVVLLLA